MLLDWLEAHGRATQVFYAWLIQFDLLTDESRQLALGVIATMMWRLIIHMTGQTPDELALEIIFVIAIEASHLSIQPSSIPMPSSRSIWQPFVLDEIAYRDAIVALDALLVPLLEAAFDERRF